jgi:hypothetical protein
MLQLRVYCHVVGYKFSIYTAKKLALLNNSCWPTICTRCPVFTALLLKIQVFCGVTPSRLVNSYRRLEEVRCFHFHCEVAQDQSTRRHIAEDVNYLQVSVQPYHLCVYLI